MCWMATPKSGLTAICGSLSRATASVFRPEPECVTFLNNTDQEVRLLVVGESNKKFNRIYYPLNPEYAATRQDRWVDHPPQFFGPHDGKPRRR